MANGYGGSGSSGGSGGSGGSSGSGGSGGYGGSTGSMQRGFTGGFLKIKDGVKAPDGFHYMPNGGLMSDADHIAKHGYVTRTIRKVDIDYSDIPPKGSSKAIKVYGDEGLVFSIEVYEGDRASYYNFKTKTWASSSYKQNRIQAKSNVHIINVSFPAQTALKTYTINIYAETVENIKTKHATYAAYRNADGKINQNKSTGSDSNIVTKTLYQDVIKNLYISAIAPSLYAASADTVNGAVSSSNRIIIDGDATDPNVVQIGDKVTGTGIAASVHALVTKINPDGDNTHEIETSVADSIGDGVAITFTPSFNGMTPNYTDSTSGRSPIEVASGSSGTFGFSITIQPLDGRAFIVQREPTVEDLCVVSTATFLSDALAIPGEDVSSSTYYRWPVANVAQLYRGNILDPARSGTGLNTTTPAVISDYKTTKTLTRTVNKNKYYTDFEDYTVPDISIQGVDTAGNPVTAIDRNGGIRTQKGNITFNVQQADALKEDSSVRIIAQGTKAIKQTTGMGVKLNITSLVKAQVTTATSAATSASTTIPVDEAKNIVVGSTVRGVGINPAVAAPTVVSKAALGGAVNIVVSSAQTLEDNITLFFDGPTHVITIRGTIEITNMPIADTELYLNVERFLRCV